MWGVNTNGLFRPTDSSSAIHRNHIKKKDSRKLSPTIKLKNIFSNKKNLKTKNKYQYFVKFFEERQYKPSLKNFLIPLKSEGRGKQNVDNLLYSRLKCGNRLLCIVSV